MSIQEAAPTPLKFTLDTNCIIAVSKNEPAAADILKLAAAHDAAKADVALVAISASERQRGDQIENFQDFLHSVRDLGLGRLTILPALAYFDITFWDHCLFAGDEDEALERAIHAVLFSAIPFGWADYCRANNLPTTANGPSPWRNAKCDVQAVWTHIHHGRDVFVTSDKNFHRKAAALKALGVPLVETPADAASRCLVP